MGWTPHTREELQKAGVQFGVPDTVTNSIPVIIGPEEGNPSVTSTDKGIQIPITITSGNNAAELGSLADALSALGTGLGTGFSDIGSVLGGSFQDMIDMIQKNTANNNAWSAKEAQKQRKFQKEQNAIAMDFNAQEAQKNRDWQEAMSNTAHQREIADLKAAGLNPILSASGGNGAAVTSGATAQGVTSAGAKGDTDTSANSAITGLMSSLIAANASMQNAKVSAQANLTLGLQQIEMQKAAQELSAMIAMSQQQNSLDIAKINSGSNQAIAQMQMENNREMQQMQLEWQKEHPQTLIGEGNRIVDWVLDVTGLRDANNHDGTVSSGRQLATQAGLKSSALGRLWSLITGR